MNHIRRFATTLLVIYAVITLLAISAIAFLSSRIDATQRALLLVQAEQATLLVNDDDIASLSASNADLSNPRYQYLKQQLTAFREANSDIRFVYVMGYHPDMRTQFFYVDSEPVTSVDYSPPGQLFPDTRPEDIDRYLAGKPYTDGPYQDSWGEWVSGYVPVQDSMGGTAYMLGIDIATNVWDAQIGFARTTIVIIAVLLGLLATVIVVRFHRTRDSLATLALEKQKLEKKQSSLKDLTTRARLGSVAIRFSDHTVLLDEQFHSLVPGNNNGRIPVAAFASVIHPDDRNRFDAMMQEIANTDNLYVWSDIRMGSQEVGFRKYHLYGNVSRTAAGAPDRFDGIMQDITDIEQ